MSVVQETSVVINLQNQLINYRQNLKKFKKMFLPSVKQKHTWVVSGPMKQQVVGRFFRSPCYLYSVAQFCLNLLQDLPACLKCQTSKMILLQTCVALCRPISSVAKPTLSVQGVWVRMPGRPNRHRLATVATFVRSCVAQALRRGGGIRHSLHACA